MPSAFNTEEQKSIRQSLLEAALRYAKSIGMRNVTVEDLTKEAGISKGAFYRFYDSKELLFLDMLEEFCRNQTEHLSSFKKKLAGQSPELMSEKLLREGLRSIMEPAVSRFFCEDVPQLLRKLTPEQKAAHFATVDEYLKELIQSAGIHLRVPDATAISVIKLLVQCASQNIEHDPNREGAVNIMAEALCKNLVADA